MTKILVLQRGWVVVGTFSQDGAYCTLTNASVIRCWGTTKGIGELAVKGPLRDTVLDACGTVRAHELAVVMIIDCDTEKWN